MWPFDRWWRRDAAFPPPKQTDVEDPWTRPDVVAQLEDHAKKTGSRFDAAALDGFKNELTGIGDFMRDKTMGGKSSGLDFVLQFLPSASAEQRWRGSDLGARIVETVPDEMTREGWRINIQPSDDDDEPKTDAFPPGGDAAGMPPAQTRPPPPPVPLEADDAGAEIVEGLEKVMEEIGASDALRTALAFARAYGGGAILLGLDDGEDDLTQPLDEERIDEVKFLTPLMGG